LGVPKLCRSIELLSLEKYTGGAAKTFLDFETPIP
jgi:hypothetical protein